MSSRVLVGYSGGKDSAVLLDLCCQRFAHVEAFFMYTIPGMEFQEAMMRWAEQHYGIKVHRVPHFELSNMLRYGVFRHEDFATPIVTTREIYDYAREKADTYWIAGGERIKDSIVRRAMLKRSGSIDMTRGRFFPLIEWSKADILAYIKQHRLPLSPEYRHLGHSFRSLGGTEMLAIKAKFPEDYARIQHWFPLIEGSVKRHEFAQTEA